MPASEVVLGSNPAVARLLEVCEGLYVDAVARVHPDLGLTLSEMPSAASTPVTLVLDQVDDKSSIAIAEFLTEIICECRGALEYAQPEAPVYRLAARIVSAVDRVL